MAYKKTDKLIAYNNEYNRDNYDRISLMVERGKKERIKAAASINGESVNSFINRLIQTELDRLGIGSEQPGQSAPERGGQQ